MADILIRGMEMPKDCHFCPMAHFNKLDALTGCDVVPGKRYVKESETDYWNSDKRPDWCPLVEIKTPYGRLIDADALHKLFMEYAKTSGDKSASWAFLFCANVIKIVKPIVDAEGGGEDG